jgi:arylesterase/paraoxonase
VLKVAIKDSGQHTVQEIYLNDGENLSGSSVAAVLKDTLLIGSVFDDHFLLCKMSP